MSFPRNFITAAAATAILTLVSAPAKAFTLGTDSILKFDKATTLDFGFVASHGDYKSVFGVQELNKDGSVGIFHSLFSETQIADPGSGINNDFLGTCGTATSAVANCSAKFDFQVGKDYTFALQSKGWDTPVPVYLATSMNIGRSYPYTPAFKYGEQVKVDSLPINTWQLRWEDKPYDFASLPNTDGRRELIDYNDFIVTVSARDTASVPEPASLSGLGLIAGVLAMFRRRKAV